MNLTIHGIAHSNIRDGWQLPLHGSYERYTMKILDNIYETLQKEEDKIFHWSDLPSLDKWIHHYNQFNSTKINTMTKLMRDGKFIIVGGGWAMSDEALPSYKETMVQMRTGLSFLNRHFYQKPTIAWQIDSYGHSSATISVLRKLGYEAMVGNKISSDYKKKLENEYGFNFYWQGHRVSENHEDDILLTHILTNDYNSLNVWNEGMALSSNIQEEKANIYEREIRPSLNSISVLSNNEASNFNSMVCLGGDFFFVQAPQLFKKYNELLNSLRVDATEKRMIVDSRYSSLYDYFAGVHNWESKSGLFRGDFLPYNEPTNTTEDFWSGFYSTRLHLKRYIRYVFNQLQAFKIFVGVMHSSKGSISSSFQFRNTTYKSKPYDLLIEETQKKWASLLSHDAITGTYEFEVESSYYKSLNETLDSFNEVFKSYYQNRYPYRNRRDHRNSDLLGKIANSNNKCLGYMFVNPSTYTRHEVMNITLPNDYINKQLFTVLQTTSSNKTIPSYISELYEMNENTHQLVKVYKIFFELEIESLSTAMVYIYSDERGDQCQKDYITCSQTINGLMIREDYDLENTHIKLEFNDNGSLKTIIKTSNTGDSQKQSITEEFNYYRTDEGSRSGPYIFNPLHKKTAMKFDLTEKYEYKIGNLTTILQVYSKNKDDQALKTYSIQLVGYTAYVDDSMKLVERPIYNKKARVKRSNDVELTGFFTYPCVYGGALRTTHNSEDHYFGWSNSHSIGCTFSEENRVEIMIYRKFGINDHKGLNSVDVQSHVTATNFQFYMHSSENMSEFWDQKIESNVKVNEPIAQFRIIPSYNQCPLFMFITPAKLLNGKLDFGGFTKHVEIADLGINAITLYNSQYIGVFNFVLRNRLGENIPVPSDIGVNHTLVKNEYIDVVKKGNDPKFGNQCNSNWEILVNDRPPLNTLDSEYQPFGSQIVNNSTLKPYEMAQYMAINHRFYQYHIDYYNSLQRREHDHVTCEPLSFVKAIRGVPDSYSSKQGISFSCLILMSTILTSIGLAVWLFFDFKKEKNQREEEFQIEISDEMRIEEL
ncbi:unnamed protein product [Moneuplotes crassus]|uniref:Alpha-mannosidase n=1 Tax=Euplotes crassus TaxID=5936 RepID=A0AAD2CZQ9_EUPCR|nr:unnamed protein product [Moneuplotes crassus]